MKNKLFLLILSSICLMALSAVVLGQEAKPVVFTTAPKLAIAKLKQGEAEVYDVRGKLTYTVTAANSDDTVAGTINYSIPDDARQKIAQLSGKSLAQVPANVTRKDIIASFQKGTEFPIIHLEIAPMDVEISGAKATFKRVTLDITGRQSENSKYTKEEMEALFTVWARQIANGRSRRGVIARINRAINGEEDN